VSVRPPCSGRWSAKDLRTSKLNDVLILQQVRTGKGIMPSFAGKLSEEEILLVMGYVKGLRI
jgi:hypothetical protein